MDHDQLDGSDHSNDIQAHHDNLQVGFVELIEPQIDSVFASASSMQKLNPDMVRLWANFFSNNSDKAVQIPFQWTDFISALLANPATFCLGKTIFIV